MNSSSARADSDLMALAQDGDREAFAALYGRYWARAVRTATVICGSGVLARDVVGVAFGEGWKRRNAYRADSDSVHSWPFGIVRRVASDSHEGDALWGRRRFAADPTETDLGDFTNDEDNDVGSDVANAIAVLLAEAPSDQREAIALVFFGELSPQKIAMHLKLTAESVEGRIRFGLAELRVRDYAP